MFGSLAWCILVFTVRIYKETVIFDLSAELHPEWWRVVALTDSSSSLSGLELGREGSSLEPSIVIGWS